MLWLKSFHILFDMAWLAGLFYMPRIMVHYVEGQAAGEDVRRLIIMIGRLFGFSSLMAALAIATGVALWLLYGFSGNWLWLKITLVLLLAVYHHACLLYIKRMRTGAALPGGLYFRIFNEAGLLIVFPIIVLVVVKPF